MYVEKLWMEDGSYKYCFENLLLLKSCLCCMCFFSQKKKKKKKQKEVLLLQSTSCKRHLFVHDNAEIMSVLMTVVLKCLILLNVSCIVSDVCCFLRFSWTTEQDSEEGKGIECLICFS